MSLRTRNVKANCIHHNFDQMFFNLSNTFILQPSRVEL